MVNNLEHGYMPLPNYLAKTLASVARFHDPVDPQGLQYRSRSNSTDNIAEELRSSVISPAKSLATSSEPISESGSASPTFPRPKVNTVNMINPSGPNANQKVSVQLPSLITPVSLYGKRIRLNCFLVFLQFFFFFLVTHTYL
jgi:60kDa lysophospholipase